MIRSLSRGGERWWVMMPGSNEMAQGHPCPQCGVTDRPARGPGRGPHAAALVCRHCGRWLRWAKKAQQGIVMHGLNRVILVGQVSDRGVELQYLPSSQGLATFTLVLSDVGKDGTVYKTYCPCEVYGQGAERAGDLDAGALVLLEGRLRWKKGEQGKDGKLVVAGFDVRPLTLMPGPVTSGKA